MDSLAILSTIPRSGTWFLRYAVAFLCHLNLGGRVDDRASGETVGDPAGPPFDFRRLKGGPLFRVRGTLPIDHLFIGHAVCPGFARIADAFPWWLRTAFHVAGYDYFRQGFDYAFTPVDLATYENTPIDVAALDESPWTPGGPRMALVHRNPLDQAVSYFRYCQGHANPAYNRFWDRPLAEVPFRDYLFDGALPSYAKQFVSFQAMAERLPGRVRLVPYERLIAAPADILAGLLDHLSGISGGAWSMLPDAVRLARPEHLKRIEAELGRSLDGSQAPGGSHLRRGRPGGWRELVDDGIRAEAIERLRSLGVDTDLFAWSADGA